MQESQREMVSDKCTKIEKLEENKNMRLMHEKVKKLTDRKKEKYQDWQWMYNE